MSEPSETLFNEEIILEIRVDCTGLDMNGVAIAVGGAIYGMTKGKYPNPDNGSIIHPDTKNVIGTWRHF